jgi:Lantibiotic dehydratase, N terminus
VCGEVGGPAGLGYAVAPMIGVRVAGAPVNDLQRLCFVATWGMVEEHIALTGWLQTEGQALSDLLFSVIGQCANGEIKPLLVALRRAVFQVKAPGDRAWSEGVRRALPADLTARIVAWESGLDRAKALEARLSEVLAAERSVRTDALRHAVGNSAFRFGLLLGSPTLADALGEWIDQPSAVPPRGQVLLRAAKYLSRAVAKTSPYASFAFSGLGGWAPSGPAACPTGDLTWHGVAELERQAVHWIWSALADRPEFREHIRVRVNPSAIEVDGQLRFLGAAVGEPVLGVARTEILRYVLDFVRTRPAPTLGGLRTHLESTVAAAGPGRCAGYVDELVGLGLLELRRPFADQGPDPLGELAHWITATADASVADAGGWYEALRELRAAVSGYPDLADARTRTRRLQHIHATLADLLTELTQPPGVAQAAELPVKDLVRENAVLTHPVVTCGWEQWQPVFDDLDTLRGFLGIFNPHLPVQARAAAFFLDRFSPGAAVGFLDFYREFHAAHPPGKGRATSEPLMRELAGLRRAAVESLYHGAENSSGIVAVDPRTLAKIAASWPPGIRAPGSICCYAQQVPGPNGPRLVLNTVCTGYGWGISRIHHLITQRLITPRLITPSVRPAPIPWPSSSSTGDPGVLLVECRAAFATNLSLRPAAVPYALDYPRADCDTDAATRISIAELTVSYDPVRDRLVLRGRCGVEVRPLALGMLVEHSLPPALYFLIRVFGEPQTALAPHRQLSDAGWRTAANGLRWRPRLEMGRIVLVRAAWSLPADHLPLRAKGESDAAFLLRVARWRDQHGIPRQCFVRVIAPAGSTRRNRSRNKARKPLYLDFANWFLLTAFERSLATPQSRDAVVVFEEALPDLADAPRYGKHGQRVTEYIVELSAAATDG